MKRAKTPEDEVEPLADPEPDVPPPVEADPDENHEEDAAAKSDETPPPGAVDPGFGVSEITLEDLRDLRAAAQSFELSAPHQS